MKVERWIFVRGLTRSKFHWLGFDEKFKAELNLTSVECVEIPGNGFLAKEKSYASLPKTIEYLRSKVDFSTGPVGLLGISMGGMIAAEWAAKYPEEIQQLVLINSSSSASPFYHRLIPKNYFRLIKNLVFMNPESLENFVMQATSNDPTKWKPQLNKLINFKKENAVSLGNFWKQLNLSREAHLESKPIKHVLILASEKDRLVSYQCSRTLSAKWSCDLNLHPSAGHDLTLDDPDWVIQQVKQWNDSL